MKKLGKLFIALLLCAALFAAFAAAANADGATVVASGDCGLNGSDLKWTLYSDGRMVITGSGEMGNFGKEYNSAFPSFTPWIDYLDDITSLEIGSGVTSVGSYAFYSCKNLVSVSFPETLVAIYSHGFASCSSLEGVSFPHSLTTVDNMAFWNCNHIKKLTVCANITEIGNYAFGHNKNIKTAGPIGGGYDYEFGWTKEIPGNAFSGCDRLTGVVFPEGLTKIGYSAFYACTKLSGLVIPDTVTSIGVGAFSSCGKLSSIVIPASVTEIESVFGGCISLKTAGPIGGNYDLQFGWSDEIPDYALSGASSLSTITLPKGITKIGTRSFSGCSSLTNINLPDTLSEICYNAFRGCRSLKSITFPKSLEMMWSQVFQDCGTLTEIVFLGKANPGGYSDMFADWTEATVYYPAGDKSWNKRILNSFPENYKFVALSKPSVTTQPKDVSAVAGKTASFKVVAEDADSYRWYYRSTPSDSWAAVNDGGKAAVYEFTAAAELEGYQYRCRITNRMGSVYTNAVTLSVVSAPVITMQPENAAVNAGKAVTFRVEAKGGGLSYQWYYQKPGETVWTKVSRNGASAVYTFTPTAKHNGNKYRCEIKNAAGSVTSDAVTLTVYSKPLITAQPENATVYLGKKAVFKIGATGGGLSYQWYVLKSADGSWTAVSGASGKTAKYSFTAAAKHNGYKYKCIVTNELGSTESSIVELEVSEKPVVISHPSDVSAGAGKSVSFTVKADGATGYQWYYRTSESGSWTAVKTNGKAATYTLTAATRHDGYQYRCKVTNAAGGVYSNAATLTIIAKPTITTQPTNKSVAAGKTATFKVVATGAAAYQWFYRTSSSGDWTAVKTNGKAATYKLTTAARHNGYQYRCKVSNAAGSVYSKVVTLAVASKPTITTQPVSVTVSAGKTATFKVAASGTALSYQWYYLKPGASSWTKVSSNGTAATYSLTTAARHDGYMYRCVVKNAAGSVTSDEVTLTVK